MKPKPNRDILLQIMLARGLSRAEISVMADRKLTTIEQWLSRAGKDLPDTVLQLLKYKIGEDMND